MTLLMADLVQAVRYDLNDTSLSHLVKDETPSGVIDSSNKVFYLRYCPIVGTTPGVDVMLTKDGAPYTNFTIDARTGKVTLSAAPTVSLKADYYFYCFMDAEIESWITSGVEYCGGSVSSATPTPTGMFFDFIVHVLTAGDVALGSFSVPWNKATMDKIVFLSGTIVTTGKAVSDVESHASYDGANITSALYGGFENDQITIMIVYRS